MEAEIKKIVSKIFVFTFAAIGFTQYFIFLSAPDALARPVVIDTTCRMPVVNIASPEVFFITNVAQVSVSGTYQYAEFITVNGAPAVLNQGVFTLENIALTEGENVIAVTAHGDDTPCIVPHGTPIEDGRMVTTRTIYGILDTIAPTVNILEPSEGSVVLNPNITIKFSAQDANLNLELFELYGAYQNPDGTWQYNFHAEAPPPYGPDGDWTLYALAADYAGNVTWQEAHITLDTEPPYALILYPEEALLTNTAVIPVVGVFNQANQVLINGRQAEISGNLFYLSDVNLEEGNNAITAEVTDYSGTTALTRNVILDTIPPPLNLTPTLQERKGMTETPYIFTAQAEDVDPGTPDEYQFEINHVAKQAYSPNHVFNYTPLATESGNKTLTVKARDVGGETSQDIGIYVYRRPL